MRASGLTLIVMLAWLLMAGTDAYSRIGDLDGRSSAMERREAEAAAKKQREAEAAAAQKRAAAEKKRIADIQEAELLKKEAQKLLAEVEAEKIKQAATQEKLSQAEAALKESQTNHADETAKLKEAKLELEKNQDTLERREISFSTSWVVAGLGVLFGFYQYATSRRTRRLGEEKAELEIAKIKLEMENLRQSRGSGA